MYNVKLLNRKTGYKWSKKPHFTIICWTVRMCVEVAQSCPTLYDPRDHSPPAPLSMEFSRQGYWNGLPFPTSGDLPNPEIKPRSPALQSDFLLSEPPGNCKFLKLGDCYCLGFYPILGIVTTSSMQSAHSKYYLTKLIKIMWDLNNLICI